MTDVFSKSKYQAVGLLRANWIGRNNTILTYLYATAWLVAPRLLLTCQHAIFNQKIHMPASEVLFLPGIAYDLVSQAQFLKAQSKNYYRALEIKRFSQTLTKYPTINQLCLVVLEKPIIIPEYIEIGSLQIERFSALQIIGYPNKKYCRQIDIKQIIVERIHSKGIVTNVTGNTIHHSIKTENGQSGSPILAQGKDRKVYAIGMHTHSGFSKSNFQGLFFTKAVINLLLVFQEELLRLHQIKETIIFTNDEGELSTSGCRLIKSRFQDEPSQIFLQYEYEVNLWEWQEEISQIQAIELIEEGSSQDYLTDKLFCAEQQVEGEGIKIQRYLQISSDQEYLEVYNCYFQDYYQQLKKTF